MKFVVRDDDTNFFTKPEELKRLYSDLWDIAPISIAVVPFHSCTKTQAIPKKYWKGDLEFPLLRNKSLIDYLKKQVKNERAEILLHGYNHIKYQNGFEFEVDNNLYEKVKKGKNYLSEIFSQEITTFVPPNNTLSIEGTKAIEKNSLNVLISFSHQIWERPIDIYNITNFLRMFHFWLRYGKSKRYPHVLKFKGHKEFGCYHLIPSIPFKELIEGLEFAYKMGGDFCVAIHYWETLKYNLKPYLIELIKHAKKLGNVEFVTAKELWR